VVGGSGRDVVDGSGGGSAGYAVLRGPSPGLTAAAMPLLLHKHSRVRSAALLAIRALVPNGAAENIRGFLKFALPLFYLPCPSLLSVSKL
jgi:hypothetical protein